MDNQNEVTALDLKVSDSETNGSSEVTETTETTATVVVSQTEITVLTNIHYDLMILIFIILVIWCSDKVRNALRSLISLSR